MAQNKITATFGADVSEVEAKMLTATRATKYYENAVKQVAKAEAAQSSGGFLGKLSAQGGKAVGVVKSLSGALGAAGAAAGLVPGLGVAAIGVAAVVAGVNKIREYYADAAESARKIQEFMGNSGQRNQEAKEAAMTDEERLKYEKQRVDVLRIEWQNSVRNGESNLEILAKREKFDIAKIAIDKRVRDAEKKGQEGAKKAADDEAKKRDEDFAQQHANLQRTEDVKKAAQDVADKAFDEAKKAAKQEAAEEGKRLDEIAKRRYENAWRYATFDQKLRQVVKEGREAQAAVERNANSKNLIALDEARNKYRDLLDELKKVNEEKAKGNEIDGQPRNAKGRLTSRSGNVVVSEEDRARTLRTRARTDRLTAEAKSRQVRSVMVPGTEGAAAATKPLDKTENLLAKIESYLKPTDGKK